MYRLAQAHCSLEREDLLAVGGHYYQPEMPAVDPEYWYYQDKHRGWHHFYHKLKLRDRRCRESYWGHSENSCIGLHCHLGIESGPLPSICRPVHHSPVPQNA